MQESGDQIRGQLAEWANQTTLHPAGIAAVLLLGVMMLCVPRRYGVLPMLLMACFVASAQRIVILELDFSLLRIMVLFGWLRVFTRREFEDFKWKTIDGVLIAWALVGTVAFTVQRGGESAFIYKCGETFDAIGMYFLFRFLIRDWEDVITIGKFAAILAVPVAGFFLLEKATGRNVFSIFGGVPEITMIRQGKLRAQGAFSHAILAGCFWAALFPLLLIVWKQYRFLAVIGAISIVLIVIACASSTPMGAMFVVVLALCFFPLRRYMSTVRWITVFTLLGLHLVMKAPVWHLISRIDLVGGSTGWHRYYLIDQAIHHFSEWALVGSTTTHWGLGLQDVTNQFVLEGIRGGAVTLILFIAQIVLAFKYVGQMRAQAAPNRTHEFRCWCLGVVLIVHCASFIGVSYFGQIQVIWYLTLAMITSLSTAPVSLPISNLVRYNIAGRRRESRGLAPAT